VTIKKNQRIAQMICENAVIPQVVVSENLSNTTRNNNGFGSTEQMNTTQNNQTTPTHDNLTGSPNVIPFDSDKVSLTNTSTNDNEPIGIVKHMDVDITPPYHISLGSDPFDDVVEIEISTRGQHPTLGLLLTDNKDLGDRLQLTDITAFTLAARIPRWRSTLRSFFPLSIDGTQITTEHALKKLIRTARKDKQDHVKIKFGMMQKTDMHPQSGIPIVFHDQLNVIAKHLTDIKQSISKKNIHHQKYLDRFLRTIHTIKSTKKHQKLTRKLLKQHQDWSDWSDWLASEHKQLNQYEAQGMFSTPEQIPHDTNCLPFIWTYMIKDDGTKKARGVCNGSPRMKGTVTLGQTYAASLDQTCAKIFWALNAAQGNIVVGADASNAFAEAPPPTAPLYMKLDFQFHTWWKSLGQDPIPDGYGVKVNRALQGHPESPRLWAKLIDKIIVKLGFQTCKHEPCLYYHPDYKSNEIYFIRQVDDFAIGCPDKRIAEEMIDIIDSHMTIKIKHLGVITRFNSVDITQTRNYIKISNNTYFNKILDNKHQPKQPTNAYSLPMNPDPAFNRIIEESTSLTDDERDKIEKQYSFSYRQGVGEIIFGMVTSRPDPFH